MHGTESLLVSDGPVAMPEGWLGYVNEVETEAELAAVQRAVARGSSFGREHWVEQTAKKLGLESTLRGRGRPKKPPAK